MDSRVIFSKQQIRSSMESLLREKPLEKIQLTEVCHRAGINRSTFYRYYDSLNDWCEQIRRAYLDGNEVIVGVCADRSLAGRIAFFADFLGKNLRLFTVLLSDSERFRFMESLFSDLVSQLSERARHFIYSGLMTICAERARGEGEEPAEDFTQNAAALISKLLY